MKKIVGIIAAASVAACAFAVDLNSMIQIDGDLLNYDGETFKAIEANAYDPSGDSDYLWKFSVSGEKSGAEIWSWNSASSVDSAKVWFKPIDMLKVTVGNVGGQSIASPQFGWWAQTAQNYSYGYQVEFTLDAISAKLALEPGAGSYFFDNSQKGLAKVGGFWAEASYNFGEWGTVQAIATRNGTIGAHGFSNWGTTPWAFGVAWNHMPYAQTGWYVDVIASLASKQVNATDDHKEIVFQGVDSQFGGQWMYNGIGLRLTNLIQYRFENGYNAAGTTPIGIALGDGLLAYGFEFKGTYALDGFTPYIQIDGYKVFAKKLDSVAVGVELSVGSASMYVAFSTPVDFTDYKFTFSIPCEITLNL